MLTYHALFKLHKVVSDAVTSIKYRKLKSERNALAKIKVV